MLKLKNNRRVQLYLRQVTREFNIGEEVSMLDEAGTFKIIDKKEGLLCVEDEHGFDRWIDSSQCVRHSMEEEARPLPETKSVKVEPDLPFKRGDEVVFLNGTGNGKVLRIEGRTIAIVEDEYGFEEKLTFDELILKSELAKDLIRDIDEVTLEEIGEEELRKKVRRTIETRRDMGVWEIDLHVQELVDNSYGMPKYELLQIQLDHFTSKLDEAIDKGLKKVIFIHGRGTGRLRKALKDILERYPNCDALDGDYNRYGVGALEVRIKYRMRRGEYEE